MGLEARRPWTTRRAAVVENSETELLGGIELKAHFTGVSFDAEQRSQFARMTSGGQRVILLAPTATVRNHEVSWRRQGLPEAAKVMTVADFADELEDGLSKTPPEFSALQSLFGTWS